MITRESLEEMKRNALAAIEQNKANINANQGAVQIIEELLKEFEFHA